MMSQNRIEARDRLRSEKVNLRAELEIRYLHEKLDVLLLKHQWQKFLKIQQI